MEERLKKIENTLNDNKNTLDRIEIALIGDKLNHYKGVCVYGQSI